LRIIPELRGGFRNLGGKSSGGKKTGRGHFRLEGGILNTVRLGLTPEKSRHLRSGGESVNIHWLLKGGMRKKVRGRSRGSSER